MSHDSRDIFYAVGGLGFGVWSFFMGFTRLRRKRLIENTPTSTIRSMAMGLVEVVGKVQRPIPLKTPLSQADCVLYRYTVERYESHGKSSEWVTVSKGDSFNSPFVIADATAKTTVFPRSCELMISMTYEYCNRWGQSIPANITCFMEANGIKWQGFFHQSYQMRFREWFIRPDETVFVLGTAGKNEDFLAEHKAKVYDRLQQLKNTPGYVKEIDTNEDGTISQEEWEAATARMEQKVLEEEVAAGHKVEDDVVIGKGEDKQVFIISDKSQKDLEKSLAWQSCGGIFGGAALAVAMLAYLIWRLTNLGGF